MDVRMEAQLTRPGVQYHRDANTSAQTRLAEFEKGLARRREEGAEDLARGMLYERAQVARKREDDVEVPQREKPP